MYVAALRLALTKVDGTVSPRDLACALVDAESLERIGSEFESKINDSKAKRGEKTKLSESRRAQLAQFQADAESLEAEQLAAFKEMSCAAMVEALKSGLDSDLAFWAQAAKRTHPADLPVVEELVTAKQALQRSLAACLPSA